MPTMDFDEFYRYYCGDIQTRFVSPPYGIMVTAFCGWTRVCVLVTNQPPPGYDQENTIEGSWIARSLRPGCRKPYIIEFDPQLDVALGPGFDDIDQQCAETEPEGDQDEKHLSDGDSGCGLECWACDNRNKTKDDNDKYSDDDDDDDDNNNNNSDYINDGLVSGLSYRVLRTVIPAVLDVATPFEAAPHPYFHCDSRRSELRTAKKYFMDTILLQLATRNGKLEVVRGHYYGPDVAEPSLPNPSNAQSLGFSDPGSIPTFQAADISLLRPYTTTWHSGRRGNWFKAAGPGLGDRSAICVLTAPGGFWKDFKDQLRTLARIRNLQRDTGTKFHVVPMKGKICVTLLYLPRCLCLHLPRISNPHI